MRRFSQPFFATLFALTLILVTAVIGQEWIKGHMGKFGGCCGEDDCKVVAARVLQDLGETKVIEVNGIQMTVDSSIVKASQDQNAHWCHLAAMQLDPEFGPSEESSQMLECASGKISEECAHCVFVVVGM